jgi:hypothetical protein
LVRLLVDIGFADVLEIHAPLEPGKPSSRVTLVATGGERVSVSTYPWINALSEDEIAQALALPGPERSPAARQARRRGLAPLVNAVLRTTLGVEVRRV